MPSHSRATLRRRAGQLIVLAHERLRRALRPPRRAARAIRHVLTFRAPDERQSCPACGAPGPVPLLPIPLEGRAHTYGFASGCRRCGVVFANPLPTAAQVAAVYAPDGDWGRHRQEEVEKPVSRDRLVSLFAPVIDAVNVDSPPPGAAVLDVGCGGGGMLDAFAAFGWRTFGIEPATKTAFPRHRELSEIPADAAFDVAVLHHVLEHVTDPLTILTRVARAVREGGVVLISVPNLDAVAVHGDLKYCIRAGVHVLAYTGASLAWLAAEAGFQVVSDRSGLSDGRQRRRIVLARRQAAPARRPALPLDAARAALARYRARHRGGPRLLPVRMQAALLDLQRREWRV